MRSAVNGGRCKKEERLEREGGNEDKGGDGEKEEQRGNQEGKKTFPGLFLYKLQGALQSKIRCYYQSDQRARTHAHTHLYEN